MIKLGTYLVRGSQLTPEERLRIIKGAGFDFICFNMKEMLEGESVGLTPELCGRVGIDFDNVHLTGNGTHAVWAEGERGDKIVERYCKEIKLCAEYGIKTGITHVTWGTSEPPPVCELGLRRFRTIAECAEKYGVVVALENFDLNSKQEARVALFPDNFKLDALTEVPLNKQGEYFTGFIAGMDKLFGKVQAANRVQRERK